MGWWALKALSPRPYPAYSLLTLQGSCCHRRQQDTQLLFSPLPAGWCDPAPTGLSVTDPSPPSYTRAKS